MKCKYCNKIISPEDPMYPTIHYKCSNKVISNLEEHEIINVLGKEGIMVKWSFTDSYMKYLEHTKKQMDEHILSDETIDDDIIFLQAVMSSVLKRIPSLKDPNKISAHAEWVFNSFMMAKYGHPIPDEKKYHSRMKEFAEGVKSIKIKPEDMDFLKRIFGNEAM